MNYEEAISWIHGLYRFGSNPGLERIEGLMQRLDNPQNKFRSIHVAGTNGKGSTAAFIASMLEAEGYRTGLYTSPYLEAFTNRMAINGEDVDPSQLARLVKEVREHVEDIAATPLGQPTEFEVVTALAFLYFAQARPDWVVVEVGLGGRLDATNVITPVVSAITNIGLEHTQVLGDTIEKIAFEKGGIIKAGIPVATAAEKPGALAVFRRLSAERGAPLYEMDKDFAVQVNHVSFDGVDFDYSGINRVLPGVQASLAGRHQARNAGLALAVRELLPAQFNEEAARQGLANTFWPGRLEIISRNPLVIVDGAHNTDGIVALRNALDEILGGRKLRLVLGILGDKAVDEILSLIAPLATAGLIITRPDSPRAADPHKVAELARHHMADLAVTVAETIPGAIARGLAGLGENEALCVSGSLYTISEARKVLKHLFNKQ